METINGANGNVSWIDTNMTGAAAGKTAQKPVSREAAAAKKVAKEFESLFVGMMLKSMRETVGKEKLTNGGHGEEIYRSLLDQEYARSLTEHGGVGLAAMLERQLNATATDGALKQGINNHDTTTQSAKTEVNYENR
jgi:peptidoglycan hydrolase FlgJ